MLSTGAILFAWKGGGGAKARGGLNSLIPLLRSNFISIRTIATRNASFI